MNILYEACVCICLMNNGRGKGDMGMHVRPSKIYPLSLFLLYFFFAKNVVFFYCIFYYYICDIIKFCLNICDYWHPNKF